MPPGGKILNHLGQLLDLLNNFAQDANFQIQEKYPQNKSFMHSSAASKKKAHGHINNFAQKMAFLSGQDCEIFKKQKFNAHKRYLVAKS